MNFNVLDMAGLTQAELGRLVGVSRPTVNAWVNGHKAPSRPNQLLLNRIEPTLVGLIDRGLLPNRLRGARRAAQIDKIKQLISRRAQP